MVDRQKNPKMSMIPDQILTNFQEIIRPLLYLLSKAKNQLYWRVTLFFISRICLHCPGKRGDKNGKKKLKKGKNISGCLSVGNGLTAELTAGLRLYH